MQATTTCTSPSTQEQPSSLYEEQTRNDSKIRMPCYNQSDIESLHNLLEIARDENKYQWIPLETKDDRLQAEYLSNSQCILRSHCVVNATPEDLFHGLKDYKRLQHIDPGCLDIVLKHQYDAHRRIVSGSYHAPYPYRNREFLFKQMRALLDDKHHLIHKQDQKDKFNEYEITKEFTPIKGRSAVSLATSVDPEKCPFVDVPRPKHTRGTIHVAGTILTDIGDGQSKLTYVVSTDFGGYIPKWMQKWVLPRQADNALKIKDYMERQVEHAKRTKVDNKLMHPSCALELNHLAGNALADCVSLSFKLTCSMSWKFV